MGIPDSGWLTNQVDRLRRILASIVDLIGKGHQVVINWDINIDHLVRNDPEKRWDILKLLKDLDVVRSCQ